MKKLFLILLLMLSVSMSFAQCFEVSAYQKNRELKVVIDDGSHLFVILTDKYFGMASVTKSGTIAFDSIINVRKISTNEWDVPAERGTYFSIVGQHLIVMNSNGDQMVFKIRVATQAWDSRLKAHARSIIAKKDSKTHKA